MKTYLLTFVVLFSGLNLWAQAECSLYHRKACEDRDGIMMKYDSQSKSAILGEGQSSEFHMVAYKGLDYRILVCAEDILGDNIQFKIFEKVRKRLSESPSGTLATPSNDNYSDSYEEEVVATKKAAPRYEVVKELLYDNANHGYVNKIEFTAEGPMSLIIQVTIPGSGNKSKLKIREMGCVGVLVEHIKSRRVGF